MIPNYLLDAYLIVAPTKAGQEMRRYLFAKPRGDLGLIRTAWCRLRGHPAGVWWYSSGFEPDMSCKNCNDDLG